MAREDAGLFLRAGQKQGCCVWCQQGLRSLPWKCEGLGVTAQPLVPAGVGISSQHPLQIPFGCTGKSG